MLTALRRQNQVAVVGFVERGAREHLIRGDARIQSLDDLRALPVGVAGAQPILLSALAEVSEARAPRHYVVHGNAVPAVAFLVRKQPGASTMQVVRAVDGVIANLKALHVVTGFHWRYALVFGALIAATDPIAVVAMFK